MSKDVSEIVAKLDAKAAEIVAKDEKADDKEILESIGKEKLQKYLEIMPLKVLHNVLKSGGYKGSIVLLRKQLAAIGAREIQQRPEGLKKGGKPKGKQKGKAKEKHEELTQVSLLPPESKAPEKQQEKPETPPVQQAEKLQEAQRTIHITGQGAETQGQQQADDDFAALFAHKAGGENV